MAILIQESPNGGIENGAHLGATSDFVTINTVVALATGDIGGGVVSPLDQAILPTNQENLQKLMELVQTTTNAKYINVTSAVVDLSISGNRTAYGLGTNFNQAATTIYTVKFMAEQINFFNLAAFAALVEGVPVPNPTTGVPVNGPATVTISAYESTDAAATNISATKTNLSTTGY